MGMGYTITLLLSGIAMHSIPYTTGQSLKTIQTQLGNLTGLVEELDDNTMNSFLNIPFAKPPIGNLRFRRPEPFGPWSGTLNATVFGPSCIQSDSVLDNLSPNKEKSEDCLQLNIVVPYNLSSTLKRSVMFWVHGGGYMSGQAQLYDARLLALKGNVIVVTTNYRLGILGFLNSGDNASLGNYGLWDQMLALKWVKDNIASFGGDPNSITIFGESAGGWSVSFLSFIPRNRDLFHRRISQSGVASSALAVAKGSVEMYRTISRLGNCNKATGNETVECLRQKTTTEIMAIQEHPLRYENYTFLGIDLGPVVDGDLLRKNPQELLQDPTCEEYQFFMSIPFITGTTNREGSILADGYLDMFSASFNSSLGVSTDAMCDFLVPFLITAVVDHDENNRHAVQSATCKHYTSNVSIVQQGLKALDLFGDIAFVVPSVDILNIHSASNMSASYQYLFNRPDIMYPSSKSWFTGSAHAAEIPYLFGLQSAAQFSKYQLSQEEINLSGDMMSYWTNFAKTGNPNGAGLLKWPQYQASKFYINLDEVVVVRTELFADRMNFWLEEVPSILSTPKTTTIQTNLGAITGVINDDAGGTVNLFLNIPFAKPPIGDLRFRKPEPYGQWAGTLDATQYGPSCIQGASFSDPFMPNPDKSEDCLQLNIAVPNNISSLSKRSVMVWVYGGGYTVGMAQFYDARKLALRGDVIVVTINYRLGILGFLNSGDGSSPGNFGLWDQMLALQWVQDNIASFGGNPDSVTIFGESAGSFSVSLLSLIPRNKGLFHRRISQSGELNSPVATIPNSLEKYKVISNLANCTKSSSSETIQCLREKSAVEIMSIQENPLRYADFSSFNLDLGPVIDGDLFKDNPQELVRKKYSDEFLFFKSIPFITGTTNREGSLFIDGILDILGGIFRFNASLGVSTDIMCNNLVPWFAPSVVDQNTPNRQSVLSAICQQYSTNGSDEDQALKVADLVADLYFVIPAVKMLDIQTEAGMSPSYQYLFHRPSFIPSSKTWFIGSGHGAELAYIFDVPGFARSSNEDKLADDMLKYWTNFAKTGNPNGQGLVTWPEYGSSKSFINLDVNITTEDKVFESRVDFWLNTIPEITNQLSTSSLIIETKLGRINGSVTTSGKEKVFEFRNIPFAKPPIGNLRFRKPEAYGNWTGILDATSFGPSCMQSADPWTDRLLSNKEKSENCLQLNIVVPNNISTTSKKSVMFWVYGGGYLFGQAQVYNAKDLALRGNVIVVAPNYRLGILGFLHSGDKSSPGNFGLWDQMLALQWVKDNIASFGGDPDSVTIFGESAGAFSVSLLSLIPRNRGLFHRRISQSGVASSPSATQRKSVERYQVVANISGCKRSNSSETIECLRQKTSAEIISIQEQLLGYVYSQPNEIPSETALAPVVDNDLFRKDPYALLFDGPSAELSFFKSIPFITGNTNREGSVMVDGGILELVVGQDFNTSLGLSTDIFCKKIVPYLTGFLSAFYIDNLHKVQQAVCEKYSSNISLADQAIKATDLVGDLYFIVSAVRQLEIPMTTASYQYLFHRPLPSSDSKPWFTGSPHAADLNYLFDFQSPKSAKEERLSDAMLQYWSNFAKTGNPNGKGLVRWPQYGYSKLFINLDEDITVSKELFSDRVQFWINEIPRIANPPSTRRPRPAIFELERIQFFRFGRK